KLRAARGRADAVRLPLPTIAVGNLSVGGTGKTPLAAWIADYCVARGRTPGILLRGYGGDEPLVHRRVVAQAVVYAYACGVARALSVRLVRQIHGVPPVPPDIPEMIAVTNLEGMRSGGRQELEVLAGRRVTAAAGIADPESFAAQLGTAGASVQLVAYQDHHA